VRECCAICCAAKAPDLESLENLLSYRLKPSRIKVKVATIYRPALAFSLSIDGYDNGMGAYRSPLKGQALTSSHEDCFR
jgi:hypothetical protein